MTSSQRRWASWSSTTRMKQWSSRSRQPSARARAGRTSCVSSSQRARSSSTSCDLLPIVYAVPNISTADRAVIDAADPGALDVHSDADHGRAVLTLAGEDLLEQVLRVARVAAARIDLRKQRGQHPRVGAIDVAPIVFTHDADRGRACALALVLADRLGEEVGLPVFLYGLLAGGRTRAQLRLGGVHHASPDFGPRTVDERTGAVLVAARPPLVAFNFELASGDAAVVARAVRGGPVRALGMVVRGGVQQVSCNVEDHRAMPLARLLHEVERHAPVARAELVGLAPRAAFDAWPERVPIRNRAVLEDRLASG
jgi:glutamate formiminotransferase / 5-formyltetrahydrofolate cyclo-ligase